MKKYSAKLSLFVMLFLLVWNFDGDNCGIRGAGAITAEEDLTLTREEKMALDKFKPRVMQLLPHAYMRQDIYLIRWLRAQSLDLEKAEQMLRSNLRWRKEQRMDTINTEDWSDMEEDFPYTNNTFDKAGRPIGTISMGLWNFRQVALTGKMARMQRYMNKLLEEMTQKVINLQKQGKFVTQWKVLINLEGFNQVQHACPLCLPGFARFVQTYEERYPGYADKVIHINTPPMYELIVSAVRPILAPNRPTVVYFLGQDKAEWMPYLDKEVSREQRAPEFGGTLKE